MTIAKPDQTSPADWVAQAIPGARIVYHTGDLGRDRYQPHVGRQACAWMRLADQRLVLLLQKRLGPNRFAYIAERTAKPVSAADHLKEITASGLQIVDRLINIP